MTQRTTIPDPASPGPSGGGLAAAIAPEAVAGVLAIVVVVALLSARLAFVATGPGTSPSPSVAPSEVPTASPSTVDTVAIGTLLQVDGYLLQQGKDLDAEVKAAPVDTQNVKYYFSQISLQLFTGAPAAERLAATPDGASVGKALGIVYNDLSIAISKANAYSLQNERIWRASAASVVTILDRIPPLDTQLKALLAGGPSPSGSTPPSVGPSSAPSPSATVAPTSPPPSIAPTLPPTPTPSPPPTIAPSPSAGPNAIVDPGFETGVGAPWTLVVDPAASATVVSDTTAPHAGTASARVDIATPGSSQLGISFQQGGLKILAGAYYHVSFAARSTATRDIRIRVAGPDGQPLGNGSRVFQITPLWQVYGFDMTTIAPSDAALLAVDLGGSADSVWLDDVSIERLSSNAP